MPVVCTVASHYCTPAMATVTGNVMTGQQTPRVLLSSRGMAATTSSLTQMLGIQTHVLLLT